MRRACVPCRGGGEIRKDAGERAAAGRRCDAGSGRRRGYQAMPSPNFRDFRVFFINMVMVIGPTPPGTGVM